jgi:hypothetical protein
MSDSEEGQTNLKKYGGANVTILLGYPTVSPRTMAILQGPVPDAVRLFVKRNREYGDNANVLGPKGQFADIWRKVSKLKNIMWDESVATEDITESPEEIMMDLIGHCLLGIQMIRDAQELEPKKSMPDSGYVGGPPDLYGRNGGR